MMRKNLIFVVNIIQVCCLLPLKLVFLSIFNVFFNSYFAAGFVFLPFVWLVNFIWFFKDTFRRQAFKEQEDMKKCSFLPSFCFTSWQSGLNKNKKLYFNFLVVPEDIFDCLFGQSKYSVFYSTQTIWQKSIVCLIEF